MPSKSRRIARSNPAEPFDDLKEFIGICAQARKQLDPENWKAALRENVGRFLNSLDGDSQQLISDLAGLIRRPK